ncbi:MAG: hypothetical protein ACK4VI_05340 [Alphaproteobacteria bacterium]
MEESTKPNKITRGNAGQYFTAGELSKRDFIASITLGNCPATDILCSNLDATKFVHIQVKTYVLGSTRVMVGKKSEINYGPNFFWILAGIPLADTDKDKDCEYYIIPSKVISDTVKKNHKIWAEGTGKNGQKRNGETSARIVFIGEKQAEKYYQDGFNFSEYKNAWGLIKDKLK